MFKRSLRSLLVIAAIAMAMAGLSGTAFADVPPGSAISTTSTNPDGLFWP
jgi:hypothetical protein